MKRQDTLAIIRFTSHALVVLLVIALGWRGASWVWRILAPDVPVATVDKRVAANPVQVAARPWFRDGVVANTQLPNAQPVASGLRLVGILAGGKHPAAIIATGSGAPQAFVQGEIISDGSRLQKVAADHVIVLHSGIAERLDLPVRPGNAPLSPPIQQKETRK